MSVEVLFFGVPRPFTYTQTMRLKPTHNYSPKLLALAAENGCLDEVRRLHSRGFPWDEDACTHAAGGGHLDVLKYLRENAYPWRLRPDDVLNYPGYVCDFAISVGLLRRTRDD